MKMCRWIRRLQLQKKQHQHVSFFSSTATHHRNQQPSPLSPPPIRVSITESAGRGVFATRGIGAGQLIHTAKPLLTHPSLSKLNTVCSFCLRNISPNTWNSQAHLHPLLFCSQLCRDDSQTFCDVESRADWSAFHDYCRSQGLKYPLLVKRLACMIISGAASADFVDILQPASLSTEMILQMEEGFGLLRNALTKAHIMDEQMTFLSKQWYASVLSRIHINAFRIELAGGLYEDLLLSAAASIEAEIAVGNAVYMVPSFYNHDCDPNAHIVWLENADARLKALRDVEEGEELRICYIDVSMGRDARQRLLAQGFGFQCNCARCLAGD